MSQMGHERQSSSGAQRVRFSNRPFGVKRFQTHQHCGVDVIRGLVLLSGIGTEALPSWDSRTRRNNLCRGLGVKLTSGPSGHANSPHPSSREGHLSTAGGARVEHLQQTAPHSITSSARASSAAGMLRVPSWPSAKAPLYRELSTPTEDEGFR